MYYINSKYIYIYIYIYTIFSIHPQNCIVESNLAT